MTSIRTWPSLTAILLATILTPPVGVYCGPESGVDFQISTDRIVYSRGERMRVKFAVTNTGEAPLDFFRGLSSCTSQAGFYSFLILDRKDQVVNRSGCSTDLLMDQMEVVGTLTDPKFGILLKQWEIYGRVEDFDLPPMRGTYHLKSELVPPDFSKTQLETLAEKHIHVIQCTVPAPVVKFSIK
jgi:hypothetical protein